MDIIDERLQAVLNAIAERYAQLIFNRAREILSNASIRVTDELLNSVKVTWLKANDNQPPRILFIFAEHGIFLDQRSPKWIKLPAIEKLKEWVEAKNLPLTRIPGYKNGIAPGLSQAKKAERIAWAIAWDKRKNDTWKRKRWKRDVLRDQLLRLNQELQIVFARECAEIIADTIENKIVV